ncbi:hypothetical protein L0Z14_30270 [Burkholderia multivorans]|nr:hypothetical protein [Burkholderia multivorans]MCL4665187.1 hypothetical protein [Burkholderia multivorans]
MIDDGATLAIGGRANRRVPMALVRELARQQKRDLRIVHLDRAMNLDLLAASYVDGDKRLLQARLQAASMGLAFMPLASSADLVRDHTTEAVDDPFTGGTVLVASALRPDVAIIHAHMADRFGNVVMDADCEAQPAFDATLARAAKRVIVSVEQIVSEETIAQCARRMLLRADEVACVTEAPYGAHPASCDKRYARDAQWCDETASDHDAYLRGIGARRLFSLTRRFATKL